ncbi:MAG: PepSY domain-containing protein [Bacteroidia bacterium]|nr:PepSY domain-containing protein [Bacteroidia bacterium]
MKKCILALTCLIPMLLWGQKPVQQSAFELYPDEAEASELVPGMRLSTETGIPLLLFGEAWPTQGADPQARALQFLQSRQQLFQWLPTFPQDLQLSHSRTSPAGTGLRFAQYYKGIPVYQAEIVVQLDLLNRVTWVANTYKTRLGDLETNPIISEKQALDLARTHISMQDTPYLQTSQLMVYARHDLADLVYQVVIGSGNPLGEWEILVDAQNGTILKCASLAYHASPDGHHDLSGLVGNPYPLFQAQSILQAQATGTGVAFDTDPLATANATYGGNYVDNNDASNAQLQAEVQAVTLNNITFSGGNHSLVGPYAEIRDFEAPNRGLFAQASSNFNFNRNANGFEAVNCYYHIDQSMRYINLTLGISCMPFSYSGGVRYDPHGLNGADNSHFLGGSSQIAFGEGGVDDAEDSDVILHELGHGIHYWITGGSLSQVNGLSEGSGDYWAASYKRSLGNWTSGDAPYQWVFGWDGHNPFWGGRITNYGASYPGGLVGQIHTDGQIWSTCMMKIWDAIGKTQTDRAFLEGLALTNSSSSQFDAALAVQTASINMGYPPNEITTLTTILQGCGYGIPNFFSADLTAFTATRLSPALVALDWETASESRNKGFYLERKFDYETEFTELVFVEGLGNSPTGKKYFQTDANSYSGTTFYRLKQTDADGEVNYSDTEEVTGEDVHQFRAVISPNPSTGHPFLNLAGLVPGEPVQITVRALNGRQLWQSISQPDQTSLRLQIPAELQLRSGIYFYEVNQNGKHLSGKFSKIN